MRRRRDDDAQCDGPYNYLWGNGFGDSVLPFTSGDGMGFGDGEGSLFGVGTGDGNSLEPTVDYLDYDE